MKATDQIRQLLDQIDGNQTVPMTQHPLAETGDNNPPCDSLDGTVMVDWWVRGKVGCMAGTPYRKWEAANSLVKWSADGYVPLHLFVVKADGQTASAADVGWMDGFMYNYNPALDSGTNYHAWLAAGRPSVAPNGWKYDVRGAPIDPKGPDFSPGLS
jgi:hypothetical protein